MGIKQYMRDLVYGRKTEPLSKFFGLFLLCGSFLYDLAVRLHGLLYEKNILKSYKAKSLVISVGNITLGGTGKTPFVMMLAESLRENGRKPAVIIRGYGEDEWKLLKDRLQPFGIRVYVGKDRIKSAKRAEEEGADTVILDDGFQHRRLRRDLDIVLVDSANAFGNRRLFPAGILREPVEALRRAAIIVVTKVDKGGANVIRLREEIKMIAPGKIIAEAMHKPERLYGLCGGNEEFSSIKGRPICAVSAICDGAYFRHTAGRTGADIKLEFVFPDHHLYKKEDISMIMSECKSCDVRAIITTEKDAVKLAGLIPGKTDIRVLVLSVSMEITEGRKEFDAEIRRLCMRDSRAVY